MKHKKRMHIPLGLGPKDTALLDPFERVLAGTYRRP